jgi:hypothetical protein
MGARKSVPSTPPRKGKVKGMRTGNATGEVVLMGESVSSTPPRSARPQRTNAKIRADQRFTPGTPGSGARADEVGRGGGSGGPKKRGQSTRKLKL